MSRVCQSSRPESGEGGGVSPAFVSSPVNSVCHRGRTRLITRVESRDFRPGSDGLSDGSKRPYKKPHTRASVCGWSSLASPALNTQIRERTKDRHIERTTRASLARGNRLDGRISRRAPPCGWRRPPRVPRASTPSTDERPPTARRVRASRESPGARRPGARVLRGGAGRRGRPKRKLRDTRGHRRRLPRGCAPVERRLPATSPVISSPPKMRHRRNHHQKNRLL